MKVGIWKLLLILSFGLFISGCGTITVSKSPIVDGRTFVNTELKVSSLDLEDLLEPYLVEEPGIYKGKNEDYFIPIYKDSSRYQVFHIFKKDGNYVIELQRDYGKEFFHYQKVDTIAKFLDIERKNCYLQKELVTISLDRPFIFFKYIPSKWICDRYPTMNRSRVEFVIFERENEKLEDALLNFTVDLTKNEKENLTWKAVWNGWIPAKSKFSQRIVFRKFVSFMKEGDEKSIQRLLSLIAQGKIRNDVLNLRDKKGKTLLHWAVVYNNAPLVKQLLKLGANVNDQDFDGFTPLYYALSKKNYTMAKLLIESGADVNIKDFHGNTPLHYALKHSLNMKFVELLVKNGAELEDTFLKSASDFPEYQKEQLTWKAVWNGWIPAKSKFSQRIVFRKFVSFMKEGDEKSIQRLLSLIAQGKIRNDVLNLRDKKGKTLLHWAVVYNNAPLVKQLLKLGANVNDQDFDGFTPLYFALSKKNYTMAKLLIESGANVNVKDIHGNTPLHYALKHSLNMKFVELLVKNGTDVNAVNKNGYTPLMFLVKTLPVEKWKADLEGYLKNKEIVPIVKFLIVHGANINSTDNEGNYPLDMVLEKEFKASQPWQDTFYRIAEILIKNGAKCSYSKLPLFFAHKKENIYDLPSVFYLSRKYPEYKKFFNQQISVLLESLKTILKTGEINYTKLGDNVSIQKNFILPITTKAYFVVLGEKNLNNFDSVFGSSKWFDYGYMLSSNGKKYPSYSVSLPAGGDAKNALVFEENVLEAGKYKIVVKTDNAHSFNGNYKGKKWFHHPPDLISPENWGFRVVFPRIGTDTVDALKEIISKTPKSIYIPKLKKLLVLANQRMKKEMRDWERFHNLERSSADRLLRFVKKNKSNIYTPKAEVLAAFKELKGSFKRLAMSKLILTEGRLLPPSEDFGDKIAKLFGLPPKNYGNDEVVVRGAQVEFRGRKVYISGIIENKGSKTLNVNVLGLFQFKTIKQTRALVFFGSRSTYTSFGWSVFKISNLKPGEKRAFVFTSSSGEGSGFNLGWVGSTSTRTFLEYYDVLPYIPIYFHITPEEKKYQKKVLKEVGLLNVDLSKVKVGKIKDIVASHVKGTNSYNVFSDTSGYTIKKAKNANVDIVRQGSGYQIDVVPKNVCSPDSFIATTSEGNKNTDPYKLIDFSVGNFPVTLTIRYRGGCGLLGGDGKEIYVKVKLEKQGAYKVFVYPH